MAGGALQDSRIVLKKSSGARRRRNLNNIVASNDLLHLVYDDLRTCNESIFTCRLCCTVFNTIEDNPLPVELPAPALKQAQCRVLWVQAANDRFGALVITRWANRECRLSTHSDHQVGLVLCRIAAPIHEAGPRTVIPTRHNPDHGIMTLMPISA